MRLAVVAVVAASVPQVAHADDEIVRGSVVKIEAREIYVNLGRDRQVEDGAAIRLKRPIKLTHPVTRATVEDWVPLGSARITQAGERLSRAVLGDLVDELRIGDVAEVLVDREDRPRPPAPPAPPPLPVDPATAEVLAAFTRQTGANLDARIAIWEGYLSTHPGSPYASAIRTELGTLAALRDQMRPPAMDGTTALALPIAHAPPVKAPAEAAIPLVFVLDQPERVASVYLHYRAASARTYRRVLLEREHERYVRGIIPSDAVRAPGVEYFLEVSSPAGAAGLALGSPARPSRIAVVERSHLVERFGPAPGRSTVRLTGEVLDFATFDPRDGDRRDRVATASVEFTYRIDRFVESIGVGYGVLAGQGGFANQTWDAETPLPRAAFQFGYADLEVGGDAGRVHVSVGGKLLAGVGRDGFGMGGEGRLRLGHRDGANLVFAGSTIQNVGFLADIRFGARPVSDLRVGVSVGATDQPNRGDIGVKLGGELEYLATPQLSVLLRGSWQGRTTEHGGLGGGAGVGFSW